jgi:hypothetical protein
MSLIGIELCDAGIMAAGSASEKLLEIDGQALESPGFALPQKEGLLVGNAAESKAHLFPRQIIHNFWDHLNTDPLEQPGNYLPQSTAEIAYDHLDRIWQQIQEFGKDIILAVPGFYNRQQLGLILGIANELSIPVRGFVPLALAASPGAQPGKMMLHLDIHLHRLEVTYVKQEEQLSMEDSVTVTEKGLIYLHRKWAEAIAQEFVSSTRFDPLHQAASEQELYDRLPGILFNLQHCPSIALAMTGGSRTYGITLPRELLSAQAESVYTEIGQIIQGLRTQHAKNESAVILYLTHRIARLPGCKEFLGGIKQSEIFELEQGAGARGAVEIWHQLSDQTDSEEISFFTSLPLQPVPPAPTDTRSFDDSLSQYPTHLLYRNLAYRISEKPLYIGHELESGGTEVMLSTQSSKVPVKYFSVHLRGQEVVFNNLGAERIYINETLISGKTILQLGQNIRVGTPGEKLQVIANVKLDDT